MEKTIKVRDIIRALESLQEQSKAVQDKLRGLAAVLERMNPEMVIGELGPSDGGDWVDYYNCILPRPVAPDPATEK